MGTKPEKLLPVSDEALADSLSFALRFSGRKRFRRGDELMAKLTAEHLVEHLRMSGFVFMRKPEDFRTTDRYPQPEGGGSWS